MDYEEFLDRILKDLKVYYGKDADVEMQVSPANNNGARKGVSIRFPQDGIAVPVIYPDFLYKMYQHGEEDFDHCVEKIVEMREHYAPDSRIADVVHDMQDWEIIKDSVYPLLLSQSGNEKLLEQYMYTTFLDFAVLYEIRIPVGDNCASCKISASLFDGYGISIAELHRQALFNMKKDGYVMLNLTKLLCNRIDADVQSLEAVDLDKKPNTMFMLTNRKQNKGAACLLDTEFLQEKLDKVSALVIPSSIHEVLVVPDNEGFLDADEWNTYIRKVNESQVEVSDRLGDHCYFWDGERQEVRMAA